MKDIIKFLFTYLFLLFVMVFGLLALGKILPQTKKVIDKNIIPKEAVYSIYNKDTDTYADIHGISFFPKIINDGDMYEFEDEQYIYVAKEHSWYIYRENKIYKNEDGKIIQSKDFISADDEWKKSLSDYYLSEINGVPVIKEYIYK